MVSVVSCPLSEKYIYIYMKEMLGCSRASINTVIRNKLLEAQMFAIDLMNLKNSGDSTGFESMTSAMPVQWSNQLSYEVTQWSVGQLVGLMFSRERNVI